MVREIANKENIFLNIIQLDVNNDSSVNDAINNIVKANGRIDILLNNAGYDFFWPS
jgi:NADP-dependent 3-hydroxy acid dehydrogenase YdfG